ncbi:MULTISPECIES: hypothetical protein [unclassified Duganella]|uniref:hypothetical protein n=1 Tax=unclassified Duganella TaxID=2636909 RepID=UPI000E353D68|nr:MULTISPECIES: hypothetical protein [unclassified Duganella]RFP10612.1 hypothetical protein D0T23_21645 [Duganella sp. BJB475]RFP27359.1 hypothetical protein D0T21_25595 [Duganella sp. BJB476]
MRIPVVAIVATIVLAGCSRTEDHAPAKATLDEMRKDEAVIENAPWFGKTGLSEEDERELPRYVRREFGRLLSEPGAIKASDLEYIGQFIEGGDVVHYWRIPNGSEAASFAYIVASPPEHQVVGWGNRRPPK